MLHQAIDLSGGSGSGNALRGEVLIGEGDSKTDERLELDKRERAFLDSMRIVDEIADIRDGKNKNEILVTRSSSGSTKRFSLRNAVSSRSAFNHGGSGNSIFQRLNSGTTVTQPPTSSSINMVNLNEGKSSSSYVLSLSTVAQVARATRRLSHSNNRRNSTNSLTSPLQLHVQQMATTELMRPNSGDELLNQSHNVVSGNHLTEVKE